MAWLPVRLFPSLTLSLHVDVCILQLSAQNDGIHPRFSFFLGSSCSPQTHHRSCWSAVAAGPDLHAKLILSRSSPRQILKLPRSRGPRSAPFSSPMYSIASSTILREPEDYDGIYGRSWEVFPPFSEPIRCAENSGVGYMHVALRLGIACFRRRMAR